MLTSDRMDHLARLCRLAPTPADLAHFGGQCAEILQYMDVLAEVDTSSTPPLYGPVDHATPFREDVPLIRRERGEVLANAPESDGQFFVVPRIV